MNWQKIKTANDVVLDGIKAEIELHDKSLKSVTLTDAKGNRVKVCMGGYSDFNVLVPAKPELRDAHLLKGEFRGLKVKEVFEHDFDAKSRLSEITAGRDDGGLTIEKVKVPVTESGDLPAGDDIPF